MCAIKEAQGKRERVRETARTNEGFPFFKIYCIFIVKILKTLKTFKLVPYVPLC